jgi:hypothetical protein
MRSWALTAAIVVACGGSFLAGRVLAQEESGGFELPEWTQMGPEQESFKKSVGDWDVHRKMWMAPGQPPMEANESATGRLVFDGRFLEVDYNGDFGGTPFQGRLLMGFDRVDKKYTAIWIDSMSTYMSVSHGTEQGGKITFDQNDPDWVTGEKKASQMIWEWKGDDAYTLTFVEPGPDGKPHTSMEFNYTRKE